MKWLAYFRLMRFDKPVGIFLLWLPTAWALWLANHGAPPLQLMIYFLLGTIFMRAAGCVINDMADRHLDKYVQRTCQRPLTTGALHLSEAFLLLFFLLLSALLILMQLPLDCFYYALIALLITTVYPFCKRFFAAPQLVLGLAFSMGIPMVYVASGVLMNNIMILLFILNFAWIVAYDTLYAMVDREDDLRIGVLSTAILFGNYDRLMILLLQMIFHGGWLCIAFQAHFSNWFYLPWMAGLLILIYQQYLIQQSNIQAYFKAFHTNVFYGLIMWGGLIWC